MGTNKPNAEQSAFAVNSSDSGLTKLEYALIHSAWQPDKVDIELVLRREKDANPYNDSYKPKLHSYSEVVNMLRVKHFTQLLNSLQES